MIPFLTACLYWGGVAVNASIVKRRSGKSPSLKPRTKTDWFIFLPWITAISLWFASSWIMDGEDRLFHSPIAVVLGMILIALGFLGTWWCYISMGNAWAISVNEGQTNRLVTTGPFGLARHPIYVLQWFIVLGNSLLFPVLPLFIALVIIAASMHWKAKIEEVALRKIFGEDYDAYSQKTGRFLPFNCC